MSVQSAVLTLLEEMQKNLTADQRAVGWNWALEKIKLEKMCHSFIGRKNPELAPCLPDDLRSKFEAIAAQGGKPTIVFRKDHGHYYVRDLRNVAGRPPRNGGNGGNGGGAAEAPHVDEPRSSDEPRKYRFKLVSFTDLKPGAEPLYLVDELIPIAGLVDVWGKAKCFKSFWTLDLMLHVAMGWEYRERYVQQGSVVYCAFEGAHGYKKRGEALRRRYGIAPETHVPLYVMPGQANLITEHRLLISEIAEQLGDTPPAAVVLDTLNKSLVVAQKNKDVNMGNYVRAAEAIRDRFHCVVIIVHHCGYDDTRPRGHSSLPGAVDAQLAVVRQEEIVTVTVEMMRDGPEETQVVSAVETVEVGQDQNGKVLTSLVVVPSEAEPSAAQSGWPRGLAVFHAALKHSLGQQGEVFHPELRLTATSFEIAFTRPTLRPRTTQKRQSKMQKAFVRALGDAQTKGLVRVRRTDAGPMMLWLPERGEVA